LEEEKIEKKPEKLNYSLQRENGRQQSRGNEERRRKRMHHLL
jgi:hypothetical protein